MGKGLPEKNTSIASDFPESVFLKKSKANSVKRPYISMLWSFYNVISSILSPSIVFIQAGLHDCVCFTLQDATVMLFNIVYIVYVLAYVRKNIRLLFWLHLMRTFWWRVYRANCWLVDWRTV